MIDEKNIWKEEGRENGLRISGDRPEEESSGGILLLLAIEGATGLSYAEGGPRVASRQWR